MFRLGGPLPGSHGGVGAVGMGTRVSDGAVLMATLREAPASEGGSTGGSTLGRGPIHPPFSTSSFGSFGTASRGGSHHGGFQAPRVLQRSGGGSSSNGSSSTYRGLRNQGATCYLNSLVQALFFVPQLERGLRECTRDSAEPKPPLARALSEIFSALRERGAPVSTESLTGALRAGRIGGNVYQQEDVHEFWQVSHSPPVFPPIPLHMSHMPMFAHTCIHTHTHTPNSALESWARIFFFRCCVSGSRASSRGGVTRSSSTRSSVGSTVIWSPATRFHTTTPTSRHPPPYTPAYTRPYTRVYTRPYNPAYPLPPPPPPLLAQSVATCRARMNSLRISS